MRVAFAFFLLLHGVVHVLGVAKAFGLAALPQLVTPISPAMGRVWAVAAVLWTATSVAVVAWPRAWWAPAIAAVVVSSVAVAASWSDAWAGAVVNVVVLLVAVVAWALTGPGSLRDAYQRDARAILPVARTVDLVTEAELAALPPPVRRHLVVAGVVGQPHVRAFRARMHGRIRSGPAAAWMPIDAVQVNVVDPPQRLFYFDAAMARLPLTGYHRFMDREAGMLVKALGLVPVARDAGAGMTRAETVTLFNDLCLMAPAALLTSPIVWTSVDDHRTRAAYTAYGHTITAELVFDAEGRLADFWSDDRGRRGADGMVSTGQRWSTPITTWREFGPFTLMAHGEARWHAPDGAFAYLEVDLDDIAYNVSTP